MVKSILSLTIYAAILIFVAAAVIIFTIAFPAYLLKVSWNYIINYFGIDLPLLNLKVAIAIWIIAGIVGTIIKKVTGRE